MTLLTARFAQADNSIAQITAEIQALQAKLSEFQAYRQQLQAVEQACESALSQVDQALLMLNHVDVSQIATFKAAVDAKFSSDAIAALPAGPEPTPAPAPEPEPAPEPVVDVTPEPESEPENAPEPADTHVAEARQSEADLATQAELEALDWQHIRKLAGQKKVGASGKRAEIATRLAGLVTRGEIWRTA